jgi:hypothetical protein
MPKTIGGISIDIRYLSTFFLLEKFRQKEILIIKKISKNEENSKMLKVSKKRKMKIIKKIRFS